MRESGNRQRIESSAVSEAAQRWERKMMNYAKTAPRCHRLRIAAFLLCVGIIALACTLKQTSSITSVASPLTRECTEWVNQEFGSPSPARNEAFIDCTARRDPSATPDELRHQLETGDGGGFFDESMTGEDLPIAQDSDCPYVRVAVQSPVGSDEVYQKPMRDLFSTELTRAGFKVVDADAMHHWWASSLTVDTSANSAAWTIIMRAVPEIGNGAIRFTMVRKTVDGREGWFSGMQSLRAFAIDEAPEVAELAAEGIAKELLPAAHRRCDDIDATLEETRVRLEQLRSELMEEIERVRREIEARVRTDRLKHLEIDVEG